MVAAVTTLVNDVDVGRRAETKPEGLLPAPTRTKSKRVEIETMII